MMKRKKLLNTTRKTILSEELIVTNSLTNLIGNMGQKTIKALIIKTNFGIHTFFVRAPIDVLILDATNKVVNIKTNLKPWKVFFWNPIYGIIIELPAGTVKKSKTEVGNFLAIQ